MHILERYWKILLVFGLSLFTILPIFQGGFFPMHDDTQVARVFEMGKMLGSGVFPVRWVPDLGYGYGYPIFNFYAPLAYYVGGVFMLLGFDALVSTKIMMGLGIMLAGIFMYIFAQKMWGGVGVGGIISTLFYMYAPYHAVNIYVRGAISELYAYAFIPLAFYGLFMLGKEGKFRYVVIGSLGFAGVVLSHNLTAMMVTPFLLIATLLHCFIVKKEEKLSTLKFQLSALVFGLLLSAFYWLPALLEMKYTNVLSQIGGGANFSDHFVCLNQLWDSHWGFGGSTPGCIDGMSFKIGKLHILSALSSIILLLILARRRYLNDIYHLNKKRVVIFFLIGGFIASVVLMLDVSKPFWEAIPLMAFFQYPWRFLLLASFFSSALAGIIPLLFRATNIMNQRSRAACYVLGASLVVVLLYFNVKLFQPQTVFNKTSADYTSDYVLHWTTSLVSDEYLPKGVMLPKSLAYTPKISGYGEVEYITVENHRLLFDKYDNLLPRIQFRETNIEKISNYISVISLAVLFIGIIRKRKRLA